MSRRRLNPFFIAGLACLILAIAAGSFVFLLKNGPKSVQQKPEVVLPLVETVTVQPADHPIFIQGQGDVVPSRQTEIRAEVGGKVTDVSPDFVVGGRFSDGQTILQIAREDYETAITTAETNLAQAELALQQEERRAAQARRDWEKLGQGKEADPLVLREPQRAVAEATVASSRSALDQARRNLDRTTISAPYNSLIISKGTELGSMLSPGSLVTIVEKEADREVRVPLSLEDYSYLQRENGALSPAPATVTGQLGARLVTWNATVLREEGRIDSTSRTAHVILSVVPNSDGLPLPPTGLFLNVTIEGSSLEDVYELSRISLQDRSQVLVLTDRDEVELRKVSVVRRESDVVYISEGLQPGERVITSAIDAPVNGMKVTTEPATGETEVQQ